MARQISRRMFLTRIGGGAAAVAVLGVAACSDSTSTTTAVAATTAAPATTGAAATTTTGQATTTAVDTTQPAPTTSGPQTAASGVWQRVNLGFVSAYVVARDGRAAVVDTGVPGSAGEIEAALTALGLGWPAVDDVILTHFHNDHVGSVGEVLAAAPAAAAYAGEADISQITSPRSLVAVGDGDAVFGLEIIETPGHTPGHVSVLDPGAGVLVAGDALNGGSTPGTVTGANPQFTPDMDTATESIRKLAQLQFETLYFGHGEPVESGAAALLAELAETL